MPSFATSPIRLRIVVAKAAHT